jgi:hypothetical protein
MDIKRIFQKADHQSSLLSDFLILCIFIIMGIIGRTVLVGWNLQPFPNFEIIMVLTFLAALIIRPTLAFLVPLISMIGSDLLLGNPIFVGSQMNKIVLFTYSGFLLICMLNVAGRARIQPRIQAFKIQSFGIIVGVGVACTLLYDVWTNIGWWYLMYPHTPQTFVAVFAAGVPFMIYHLLSASLTFLLIGVPLMMFIKNKHMLTYPKKLPSLHYVPILAVTLLFIGLSFSGTAMQIPQKTDIWLERSDATSVTIIFEGNDWRLTDSICIIRETSVLSLLFDISQRHGFPVETTYYEGFDATLVDSIAGDKNGALQYWQYFVNGELPMIGCDTFMVTNGDVVLWSLETVPSDI